MRRNAFIAVIAVLALLLAACGGGNGEDDGGGAATEAPETTQPAPETTMEEAPDTTTETAAASSSTVAVASSDLGEILVDGEGLTLYLFLPDEQGTPTCTDDCFQTWPPLEGPAEAGDGADTSLLGTVEHPSGVTMATYDGWPLYYFASDQEPGDVMGQGIGGSWYVVSPTGEPVQDGGS